MCFVAVPEDDKPTYMLPMQGCDLHVQRSIICSGQECIRATYIRLGSERWAAEAGALMWQRRLGD